MRVLAVVSQKGGCGKTTTAIHLAACLAASGRRTLLVDLDPQGHATLGLGLPPPPRERSVAAVLSRSGLDENAVPLREITVAVDDRLRLAPSGVELAEVEADLLPVPAGEERLAEHLAALALDTDRVVIDAPPSLGLLTLNALSAADDVVVPVEPSLYALHGLARLSELVRLLGERRRRPAGLRVVMNALDARTRFARRVLDEVREAFPDAILDATVRPSVVVREAAARGLALERFAPGSTVAADFRALADELERRATAEDVATAPAVAAGLVVTPDGLYLTRHDLEPERVRLAGDFNGWIPDSGVRLDLRPDGSWTKFVPLPPGRYEYKLVVDGRWVADPLNPDRVPNDAGSLNSVLEVRA